MSSLTMSRIEEAFLEVLPPFMFDEFPVSAVLEKVMEKLGAEEKDRDRVLRDTELLLAGRPDIFFTEERCFPRAAFFRGAQFRIVPSHLELERNILLPGARFAPFCDPDVFPDEYTLSAGGKTCPVRPCMLRFSELAHAYFLLGRSGLIDYLSAESNDNWNALRSHRDPERLPMEISVFDMTDFLRTSGFEEGDALIVSVTDWNAGAFRLVREPASERPGRDRRDLFLRKFESAMLQVCEREHDSIEMTEQIALAYHSAFLAGEDLRHTPDFALEDYPSAMLEIDIRRDGPEWTFVSADSIAAPEPEKEEHCSCGDPHHHHHGEEEKHSGGTEELSPDQFSASSGTLESLEAILAERNAPLDPVEIHSFALDSLANGAEKFEDFHARMMSLLGIAFADDAQETAFLNFLEEDFEDAEEYFNPSFEEEKTPLRTRLLELCEQRVELSLRLLDHFHHKVPERHARMMRSFHRDVSETLSLLCADAPLPENEDDLEQFELRIDDLEDAWDELSDHMSALLMGSDDPIK